MRKPTDEQLKTKLLILCSELISPILSYQTSGPNFISWPDIDMFGFGNSHEEAREDLLECLKEYYQELLENKDSLGVIPTHDLEVLHKFFNW